jgi:hypothetical protein
MDSEIPEEQISFVHDNSFSLSNGTEVEGVLYLIERWQIIAGLSDHVQKSVRDWDPTKDSNLTEISQKGKSLDPYHNRNFPGLSQVLDEFGFDMFWLRLSSRL